MNKLVLATPLLFAACASQPQPAQTYSHVYGCNGAITTVQVRYPNAQTAVIGLQTEDSRSSYTLHQVRAASGVKYSTSRHSNPAIGHYIWWTKGSEAILYTTAASATRPGYVYEKQLATCTLNVPPTANTAATH